MKQASWQIAHAAHSASRPVTHNSTATYDYRLSRAGSNTPALALWGSIPSHSGISHSQAGSHGANPMEDLSFNTLSSDRLVIRRFHDADAEDFAAYRSDPNVARYQGWDSFSFDDAKRFIASLSGLAPGAPDSGFQFAVALTPAGPLIGDCFLRCTPDNPRQAELGFTFASAYQGQGYAFEAVTRLLQYTFTTLDMHRVFAITDARNSPAQRLLDRLRFRLEGRFLNNVWFKDDWSSECLYAQLQEEWRRIYRATPSG